MLVASELRGELARIRPARACCRRAELVGLLQSGASDGTVSTLDHATARIAVQLAASIGVAATAPRTGASAPAAHGRHHLRVALDGALPADWSRPTSSARRQHARAGRMRASSPRSSLATSIEALRQPVEAVGREMRRWRGRSARSCCWMRMSAAASFAGSW